MNRMMAITISPGAVTAAVRLIVFGNAWPIIPPPAATSTRKNVPEQLGEQPPPLLLRVLEVLDRMDDIPLEDVDHLLLDVLFLAHDLLPTSTHAGSVVTRTS